MSGKPPTDRDERTLGPDDERSHSVSSRQSLTSFTRPLLDVGSWPLSRPATRSEQCLLLWVELTTREHFVTSPFDSAEIWRPPATTIVQLDVAAMQQSRRCRAASRSGRSSRKGPMKNFMIGGARSRKRLSQPAETHDMDDIRQPDQFIKFRTRDDN
jgi:hypothetical protein